MSRYQKGKTNLDFTEASNSEWQWHQLGHMQVCTSLQIYNRASTPPLVFTGRMPFLPPNQQRQSTEGKRKTDIIVNNSFDRHHEEHLTQTFCTSHRSGGVNLWVCTAPVLLS